MTATKPREATPAGWLERAGRIAPGLPSLLRYRPADFPHDLVAGLSVAVPVGVAYAQLTGFGPEVGLYSSILPLIAYALFGTSRQLVIGPDAATCALVAAAVAPLAAGDGDVYASLSVTLALLAGLLCIAGSFLKLGALADFLSRPILVGFMNGIALSIVLGQMGKLLGARGVTLALAGRATQWQNWARSRGFSLVGAGILTFPSLEEAVREYHAAKAAASPSTS